MRSFLPRYADGSKNVAWKPRMCATCSAARRPDRAIHRYVETNALILVTKDDDFLMRFPPVRSRLIWLRCGNISNRGLRLWLAPLWPAIEARLQEGDRVIEVR